MKFLLFKVKLNQIQNLTMVVIGPALHPELGTCAEDGHWLSGFCQLFSVFFNFLPPSFWLFLNFLLTFSELLKKILATI